MSMSMLRYIYTARNRKASNALVSLKEKQEPSDCDCDGLDNESSIATNPAHLIHLNLNDYGRS